MGCTLSYVRKYKTAVTSILGMGIMYKNYKFHIGRRAENPVTEFKVSLVSVGY